MSSTNRSISIEDYPAQPAQGRVLLSDVLTDDQHRLWLAIGGIKRRHIYRQKRRTSWCKIWFVYAHWTVEVLLAASLTPEINARPSPPAILWAGYVARQPMLTNLSVLILGGNVRAISIANRLLALMQPQDTSVP